MYTLFKPLTLSIKLVYITSNRKVSHGKYCVKPWSIFKSFTKFYDSHVLVYWLKYKCYIHLIETPKPYINF